MNHWYRIGVVVVIVGSVFGCSKEPGSETGKATSSAKVDAATPLIPFPDIANFEKKAPNDLVADLTIGKVIRSIVPQAQLKCMDEIFNYMPDLQLSKDGSVTAELNGSHADNFMVGYVNASPTGEINIVLQCLPPDDKPHRYFTNRDIAGEAPAPVLNWYYMVAGQQDVVRVSDGKETRDIPYAQFLKETLAGAAKPLQDQSRTSQQAKLESAEKTKTGGAEKAQAGSVNGQWQCKTTLKGKEEEKSLLVFKDDMFVLTLQGGMQLVSMNYKPSGAKGTGVFTRMSLQGKVSDMSNPYEVSFRSTTPDKLVFDMVLKLPQKELSSYSECVPLETTSSPSSQQSPPGYSSGGDWVADYANILASEMERASHPACHALASSIRTFGNSGAPDFVRERQVDAIVKNAPSFCFRL